jgi:hypothetical protein
MEATITALFEVSWAVARDEKPHFQREALTVATTAKREQNSRFFAHNGEVLGRSWLGSQPESKLQNSHALAKQKPILVRLIRMGALSFLLVAGKWIDR